MQICPQPRRWHEIYERLRLVCSERQLPLPPTPLILNGWVASNDREKAERWSETVGWAERHGLAELIKISPEDWYAVNHPSSCAIGPFGGPMYLPWRSTPATEPGEQDIANAFHRIEREWRDLAGCLADYTKPLAVTGEKKRRLLVAVHACAPAPPWGDWEKLAKDESRREFTELRRRINAVAAPVEFDHIDFVREGESLTATLASGKAD